MKQIIFFLALGLVSLNNSNASNTHNETLVVDDDARAIYLTMAKKYIEDILSINDTNGRLAAVAMAKSVIERYLDAADVPNGLLTDLDNLRAALSRPGQPPFFAHSGIWKIRRNILNKIDDALGL